MKILNKLPKNVPKISDEERKRIIHTRLQVAKIAPITQFSDLTNEELLKIDNDINDTLNDLEINKQKYGENYDYAMSITKTMREECDKEKKRRN